MSWRQIRTDESPPPSWASDSDRRPPLAAIPVRSGDAEKSSALDARAARDLLHWEADNARRAAQEARRIAERARLAAFTRVRHRP